MDRWKRERLSIGFRRLLKPPQTGLRAMVPGLSPGLQADINYGLIGRSKAVPLLVPALPQWKLAARPLALGSLP